MSPERADAYYEALVEDDPEELYETAPCGYVSTTPTGIITKANRTFLRWTGYDADELFHERRIQSLLPVGDRIFYETHFAPSLSLQGSVREIAVELVCATGERLPVLLNAVAKIDGGVAVAIRIAVFDARERRAYERELVAARQTAERAADEARALAETLQATFLPLTPPSIPGLDIGGAYRPAGDGRVVGGDFYDVFEIGPAQWGVVLGDVCGKGASAAVVTALSRHTVRSAAARARSPSAVLRELHDELVRSDGRSFCTALYTTVEVDDRDHASLVLSAGGHHLPLFIGRDGVVEERGEPGALLGMLGPPRLHNSRIDLGPGEALVLYTDGVIEARSGNDFFGDDRLRALLTANRTRSAQEIADAVAVAAVDHQHGHANDDIAVVVLKVP